MLPHAHYLPAASAQGAVYAPIPGPVALDLLPPEGGVGFGTRGVPGATMPEAAVHKYCGLNLRENEVRFAREFRTAAPARDPTRTENLNQSQFGALVAFCY